LAIIIIINIIELRLHCLSLLWVVVVWRFDQVSVFDEKIVKTVQERCHLASENKKRAMNYERASTKTLRLLAKMQR